MSGPLCDAVLEERGSAGMLAELARSNLLLVPLDRRGEWYRYHHLFRDLLLAELRRLEPGLIPVLKQRAAKWHEGSGQPGEALEYWMQADDADSVARLVAALAFTAYQHGMVATAERWFGWVEDHGDVEDYPAVAVLAAMIAALLCRDGAAQMQADAELATATMAAGSFWRTSATVYLGMAHLMADDSDKADVLFAAGIAEGQASGVTVGPCVALAERSLLAITNGEWDSGERYLDQARMLARDANLEDHPPITILYAAAARIALHQGDRLRAREELARAQRLRPTLTYAIPHLAVQARLELGACHLALPDSAAARVLLREIDEILIRRPDLGVFVRQTEQLRARLKEMRSSNFPGASALTAAELRLLPLLSTHLSFPEIGEEMCLSPNTIKSQAYSIYRKLGVSSRNQAVMQSRKLGFLEA
jgi:LuxR family maltose regulon positive regulatory protein